MSKQNRLTLDAYQKTAKQYMNNSSAHDALDLKKAKAKAMRLKIYLGKFFSPLPDRARIFEIGSADGATAKYLSSIGFDVTASDVADDFIEAIKGQSLPVVKFNALTDEFPQKYHGILCWRVFVHFTPDDALAVLKKVHEALEPNGRFIFNAINRETRDVDEEWVDFPGEYHMGIERYFHYYTEPQLRDLIQQAGFEVLDFHLEGGEKHNKWLVFALEKPRG